MEETGARLRRKMKEINIRRDDLYEKLWKSCAGPVVDVRVTGDRVFYFPQGHMEQLQASTIQELNQEITHFNLPFKIFEPLTKQRPNIKEINFRIQESYYDNPSFHCNCGDPESMSRGFEDPLPGLRSFSGVKRKLPEDTRKNDVECFNTSDDLISSNCKRSRL
ncbi:uncharacterized protein LOC133286252 [Gastrolobium bilobum]|uniref:uncharacterized protein LOC133286252 n=1 Tax=Gastrolobium bilobum TaxID=150636 RepID=UPI002AAFB20D|nr:uncharacterized protein LOC133286252 [Gastrolobium bilobum]